MSQCLSWIAKRVWHRLFCFIFCASANITLRLNRQTGYLVAESGERPCDLSLCTEEQQTNAIRIRTEAEWLRDTRKRWEMRGWNSRLAAPNRFVRSQEMIKLTNAHPLNAFCARIPRSAVVCACVVCAKQRQKSDSLNVWSVFFVCALPRCTNAAQSPTRGSS